MAFFIGDRDAARDGIADAHLDPRLAKRRFARPGRDPKIANLDVVTGRGYRLLVVPVDRPGFSDSTLSRLISSERTCCPMKDERGGHPLVLSADDVEGIRTASPDEPLRNLIEPFKFEVGDPHLHLNVDTSVDLIGLTDSLADL